jgi:DNA primase
VAEDAQEITTDVVDQIKEYYRLEDFFPQRSPSGGDFWMTRCPFHDDKNPSFWLNLEEQICDCHAGCMDKPMDVINLYAALNDLTNREAILMLAKGL